MALILNPPLRTLAVGRFERLQPTLEGLQLKDLVGTQEATFVETFSTQESLLARIFWRVVLAPLVIVYEQWNRLAETRTTITKTREALIAAFATAAAACVADPAN